MHPTAGTACRILDGYGRESPIQRYTSARKHILTDIQKLMANSGLAKPATLDNVLQIIMLDCWTKMLSGSCRLTVRSASSSRRVASLH